MKMREAGTGLGWRCKYVIWICEVGRKRKRRIEMKDRKWKFMKSKIFGKIGYGMKCFAVSA
jgi:hypothetical protein